MLGWRECSPVQVDLKDQASDVSSPVLLNAVEVIWEASGRLWKDKSCRRRHVTAATRRGHALD
jgi:hypothetical protein